MTIVLYQTIKKNRFCKVSDVLRFHFVLASTFHFTTSDSTRVSIYNLQKYLIVHQNMIYYITQFAICKGVFFAYLDEK